MDLTLPGCGPLLESSAAVDDVGPADTKSTRTNKEQTPQPVPAERSDKCTEPVRLTLQQGKVLASGNTLGAASETSLGIPIDRVVQCDPRLELYGPQHFFVIELAALTPYRIQLTKGQWTAALYVFTDLSCDPETINRQCHHEQPDGGAYGLGKGDEPISLFLVPQKTGDFVIAVDGPGSNDYGSYSLLVEEATD